MHTSSSVWKRRNGLFFFCLTPLTQPKLATGESSELFSSLFVTFWASLVQLVVKADCAFPCLRVRLSGWMEVVGDRQLSEIGDLCRTSGGDDVSLG